jgi:ribosomal protein S18 acetylase RimI-like enzyme
VIYKDARNVTVQDVDLDNPDILNGFIKDIHLFMGAFSDPDAETREAVSKAAEEGFCIEAVEEGKRVGVLVITRAPFDTFQPRYHLAYIATSPEVRGRGVGRLLLETSIAVTKGDIALHVGFKNQKAIAFYKKMGWKEVYCRMMPGES